MCTLVNTFTIHVSAAFVFCLCDWSGMLMSDRHSVLPSSNPPSLFCSHFRENIEGKTLIRIRGVNPIDHLDELYICKKTLISTCKLPVERLAKGALS